MNQFANFSTGQLAIAGVILTVIYYTSFFNNGSAIELEMTSIKAQIEEEKIKKVETNRVLQKEEQMRADVSMLVKKYEDVKSKIPIEFLESELRIIIDQYANQFELKTTRNQRASKGKDFGSALDANLVEQVALEYTFMGTFFNLEKLINQITRLDKLVKVESFQFISAEKKTNAGVGYEVSLTATIIGFKQSSIALNENKNPPNGTK